MTSKKPLFYVFASHVQLQRRHIYGFPIKYYFVVVLYTHKIHRLSAVLQAPIITTIVIGHVLDIIITFVF